MAFRIHEDQENAALGLRKDSADVFAANQRRALGDLSQFACNQSRNLKLVSILSSVSVTFYCSVFYISNYQSIFSRDWRMDLAKFKMKIGQCARSKMKRTLYHPWRNFAPLAFMKTSQRRQRSRKESTRSSLLSLKRPRKTAYSSVMRIRKLCAFKLRRNQIGW